MKKLLALILILALALPALALATPSELIIGCWYMLVDNDWYPEMMKNLGDYDYTISVYIFSGDGNIYVMEGDIKDGAAEPFFHACGTWEKANGTGQYTYRIIGLGEGSVRVEEGGHMYMLIPDSQLSMHMRKMIPFNPYTDYIYEVSGK